MWGSRRALALCLLFTLATWNVAFDAMVALEGARFTRTSAERYQDGLPPITIEAAYRPRVRRAALYATLLASAVLVTGPIAARTRTPATSPTGPRVDR
jgi:hypothetical protein